MGFDIEIARYDVDKCPHCGMPIKGTRKDWTESGGPAWREFLKKVGYYVPYDERTPDSDWYGKDMTLTSEQAKDLAEFVKVYEPYQCISIVAMVDCAIENGDFVVINADW
mgnify:FL=1